MADPSTSSSTATLPASWTPTGSGCLQTNDYWIWNFSAPKDAKTVAGGPSQTTECLPPMWNPTAVYAASACPSKYTACRASDVNQATTCCPEIGYVFDCVASTQVQVESDGPGFACVSAYTNGGQTMVITTTNLKSGGNSTVATVTNRSGLHLFAAGIVYTTEVRSPILPTLEMRYGIPS